MNLKMSLYLKYSLSNLSVCTKNSVIWPGQYWSLSEFWPAGSWGITRLRFVIRSLGKKLGHLQLNQEGRPTGSSSSEQSGSPSLPLLSLPFFQSVLFLISHYFFFFSSFFFLNHNFLSFFLWKFGGNERNPTDGYCGKHNVQVNS